ncbi:hypothetical protein [Thalassomonas sp. RHCl1]|nr:hypothetical protein [Thalassomonas sp. RHCl1]
MKKILLAVVTVSLLSTLAVPADAAVGGKTKPPVAAKCSWWDQLVMSVIG